MKISYWIFRFLYAFLWLITRLPLGLMLYISYLIFPFIYYIFPYRKKLVIKNISKSFPDLDRKKLKSLTKKFYMHFCVILIESLYSSVLSSKDFQKRYKLKNPELCNRLYDEGKSISLLMAHYGNWEWSNSLQIYLKHQCLAIYKPLHNIHIDKKVKKDRERFGLKTVPMEKILRNLITFKEKKIPTLTYFIADQRTLMAKIQYWTRFLNQDTPVVMGPEKIAHRFNHAVLFLKVNPVRKGYYEVEFIPLYEDVKQVGEYRIIESYHEQLEKMIREKPEYWLWSHNRWKHKKEDYDKRMADRGKK